MIDFIKNWANQIIVAVIIATIFEMLLPNGNNKKYIKMMLGIYVLFTMIQPVVAEISANTWDISNFNYEKYFDEDILEVSTQDFENNNSKLIKQAYIDNIENDIQTKLNQKGYTATNCDIDIIENENQNTYGTITKINLTLEKTEKESNNTINVENVEVSINDTNTTSQKEKSSITSQEKTEVIKYLSNQYSVDEENIIIN